MESTPGFEPSTSFSQGMQPIFEPPVTLLAIYQIYIKSERTNRHVGRFDEKTKTAPLPGRRREHGRGRPRQSRERRAWWGTSIKHHTEWWTSSRAINRAFTAKTWSSSDFSIAETTWSPCHIYLYLFERSEFLIATCKKKKLTVCVCVSVLMFG